MVCKLKSKQQILKKCCTEPLFTCCLQFLRCPTRCITIHATNNPNSDTQKYAIPAMNELERLGLGNVHISNGISYCSCKIEATTFKNNQDLQNVVKRLVLNVEHVIGIFESDEQGRYNALTI